MSPPARDSVTPGSGTVSARCWKPPRCCHVPGRDREGEALPSAVVTGAVSAQVMSGPGTEKLGEVPALPYLCHPGAPRRAPAQGRDR